MSLSPSSGPIGGGEGGGGGGEWEREGEEERGRESAIVLGCPSLVPVGLRHLIYCQTRNHLFSVAVYVLLMNIIWLNLKSLIHKMQRCCVSHIPHDWLDLSIFTFLMFFLSVVELKRKTVKQYYISRATSRISSSVHKSALNTKTSQQKYSKRYHINKA